MQHSVFPYRLYLVVSESDCLGKDFLEVTEEAIKGGVDIVQLREKNISSPAFLTKALRLKEITDRYGVPLIINDDLAVAMQVQASGIHVGNNDLAPTHIRTEWKKCGLLGYSIEYLPQLSNRETEVSDYLGISPVFSTPTKQDTVTEWGLEGVEKIRSLTSKPLVAIGRMSISNAYEVVKAGADCIAVVSAICQAKDPAKAAFELKNQIEKAN
ncbi:thiamine phosphate synthase [Flammeovirgaceae bacterium SG7u.111]|nr:thiamine phosphate synthase [Flammeovirgaceae bacterium SG7u.132]WPO37661.1 thiamine phosphate synthase [Flammeovirgaceae bacterium SG7u.111]